MHFLRSPTLALFSCVMPLVASSAVSDAEPRPRAREAGIAIGSLPPGPLNAITDVPGVRVGHSTVVEGDRVRTGVTAILPHGQNAFHERVPAAIHVANGFGKLVGLSQVRELGELETPILLTGTLGVWTAADAMAGWLLAQPGMEAVRSINPAVGETNDGVLNDIRSRPLRAEHVVRALDAARDGAVEEGAVGAGTGTVAFGWKGGIGTSSRRVAAESEAYTVGVLVQANYGGDLVVAGVPVGGRLPAPARTSSAGAPHPAVAADTGDGSIMIVVATDAPLDARMLQRLASRAIVGLARTGSAIAHGSGDYVIAFSSAPQVRRRPGEGPELGGLLPDQALTPLFQAVADATEEAILNALFRATTTSGHRGTVHALPLAPVLEAVGEAGALVAPGRD